MSVRIDSRSDTRPLSGFAAMVMLVFGCYLVLGGVFAIKDVSWPVFMPPQFDVLWILFPLFGEKVGSIVGGIILASVGVFFVCGGSNLLLLSLRSSRKDD